MHVRSEAGQFGWDYLLVFSDGKEYLVQTDHDYPKAAIMFGFADSPDEYATTGEYYTAASDWLDRHIGETHPAHPESNFHQNASMPDEERPEVSGSEPEPGASLTAPLVLTFFSSGMTVTHDGSFDRDEIERLQSRPYYNAMGELFENAISNGILEWIDPEEINAQTGAPILARSEDVQRDPNTNALTRCDSVYVWLSEPMVDAIFSTEGAYLGKQFANWIPATRMEEVVKEGRFPLEGEWEKDER